MIFAPGNRLGPYEIVAFLGAGGMGKVYRARDTQLKREVALKVLPPEVAADADRLVRFQREAELLAALNHPHIAQIYGIVEIAHTVGSELADPGRQSARAFVMELVEGETLAERIGSSPVPVEDALPLARQLTEALEYAHERGIIHRDLKPANIKITPEGKLKVLDFGLAKAFETRAATGDPAAGPTLTSPAMTQAGIILGTAAYMSPEQARGAAVDKRTDIWAFGVVLFEMLAGRPCFAGDSVTDVLAAVVKSDPDWAALPADTPPRMRDLLRRCLAKDRRHRLHDIADARLDIEQAMVSGPSGAGAPESGNGGPPTTMGAGRISKTVTAALAALVVLTLAAASVAYWALTRPAAPGRTIHAAITLPDGHALFSIPAISPDGTTVAFVSAGPSERPRLYTRRLMDDFELRAIPGTEDADHPFFSPDGRSIAFFAKRQLFRVSLDGGSPTPIAKAPSPRGGTWGDDDSIVFAPTLNGGLVRVAASGGEPQPLIRPDGDLNYGFVFPKFLPGARELLFTVWGKDLGPARLNISTGERSNIVGGYWSNTAYAASGHIVFGGRGDRGEILAVPDSIPDRGSRRVPVLVQLKVFRDNRGGGVWFDLSRKGTLIYAAGDISQNTLVLVDQSGHVSSTVIGKHASYDDKPALSPDRKRVAYTRLGSIYVWSLDRGSEDLLSTEDGAGILWEDRFPIWTPDGKRVIFQSNRAGNWDLYIKNASGGGNIEPLLQAKFDQLRPSIRQQDGTLAFYEAHPATARDIWILHPDGKREPWLVTPVNEDQPSFSPDGSLVAYTSDESDRPEIYISPFSNPRKREKVSTDGGTCHVWSPNGDRLFFRQETKIMAVDVRADGSPAGKPHILFDGGWSLGTGGGIPRQTVSTAGGFEVMPVGEHFLMVRAEPEAIPTKIHVIFNWFEELNRLVPVGK